LVNQFLVNPDLADTLQNDLFSPSGSEQQRLDTLEKAELAAAGISTAALAKAVLAGGGQLLSKLAGALKGQGAKGVPNSTLTRDELISGLPAGTKITPESVIDIRKLPDGRTVWLETGSDAAGLRHIYKRHEVDFVNKGILRDEIPTVLMNALERGKIVGTNGSANVYRITHNGVEQNIAIGVGSNGFVVRANPVSSWRPLP
jgi:filamentous hemagglutinin